MATWPQVTAPLLDSTNKHLGVGSAFGTRLQSGAPLGCRIAFGILDTSNEVEDPALAARAGSPHQSYCPEGAVMARFEPIASPRRIIGCAIIAVEESPLRARNFHRHRIRS